MISNNEELEFLQEKFKNMLSEMGLTQQEAFDIIHNTEDLIEGYDEFKKFENFKTVFKKSFLTSLKEEKVYKLRNYINILKSSKKYEKISRITVKKRQMQCVLDDNLPSNEDNELRVPTPQSEKEFVDEIVRIKNIANLSFKELADILSEELEKEISEETLKKMLSRRKGKKLKEYYDILKNYCEKYNICIKYRRVFEADDRILSEDEIKKAQRKGREIARRLKQEMLEKQS